MKLYTIGFTKKAPEKFFTLLEENHVKKIVDIRLKNKNPMISWTKVTDFPFFLKRISNIGYEHRPELAPSQEILDIKAWTEYEPRFNALIAARQIEKGLNQEDLDGACLLCAENKPDECHRRLVAEYLQHAWGPFDVIHLQVPEL